MKLSLSILIFALATSRVRGWFFIDFYANDASGSTSNGEITFQAADNERFLVQLVGFHQLDGKTLRLFGSVDNLPTTTFSVGLFENGASDPTVTCGQYEWKDLGNPGGVQLCENTAQSLPEIIAFNIIPNGNGDNQIEGTLTSFQYGDSCVPVEYCQVYEEPLSCEALEQEWLDADCACTDSADCTAKKTAWSDAGCEPQTCG